MQALYLNLCPKIGNFSVKIDADFIISRNFAHMREIDLYTMSAKLKSLFENI
jgi:hypothetical protein